MDEDDLLGDKDDEGGWDVDDDLELPPDLVSFHYKLVYI